MSDLMLDVDQAGELKAAFRRAGWTNADIKKFSEGDFAAKVLLVLMGLATIVRAVLKLACTKVFNPAEFIGKDWKVWRGPADGNGLEGDEDRDVREDDLAVIDWEQVVLETNLLKDETVVGGEEKLLRLEAGSNIRLGGKAFLSLWEDYQGNRANSVLEKLYQSKGVKVVYFFGTVLRGPLGSRCVLYLCRGGDGSWGWSCYWLDRVWLARHPSVSLASV